MHTLSVSYNVMHLCDYMYMQLCMYNVYMYMCTLHILYQN